ncbi:MAG: chemotaxis response regulator protein-glutamate methylesterase [Pseudolabrys sp.]|nr:chemotaxis response regulator protein-glutamate methylesterase [Pseudolabrys sp.]
MNLDIATPSSVSTRGRRIRVMVVDDAIVVRGLFTRWLEAEPDLELVASLRSGREAVAELKRADPDVVLLDVAMPDLDGIAALPLLLAQKPDLTVIMASTLTRRNAEISLKALSLGATDYLPKPTSKHNAAGSADFRRELIDKVRHLGQRRIRLRAVPGNVYEAKPTLQPRFKATPTDAERQHVSLRPMPPAPPRALVIGSSTGGPQALSLILAQISEIIDAVPVLITQHMPPTFTSILAEQLTRLANRPVHEAKDGDAVVAGGVYLAPGGQHMRITRRDGVPVIALDDSALINFCRPAVDPLFSSAAAIWGNRLLALVLTGMGHDGLAGAKAVVAAGGHVMAQDEPTSVVWGMPGQVAMAGLCSAVVPLPEIAPRLMRLFARERV